MQTEQLGYFKDFYANGKYLGSQSNVEKDRETLGYYGRKKEVLNEDLKLKKKTIKKGTEVITELQVICGKVI